MMAAPGTASRGIGMGIGMASRWERQRCYLLLLQRDRGHRDHQEHPEGEGGTDSE